MLKKIFGLRAIVFSSIADVGVRTMCAGVRLSDTKYVHFFPSFDDDARVVAFLRDKLYKN